MSFLFLLGTKIWALQDGTSVIIGGKTNRAKAEFEDQINCLLDQVPELVESPVSKQSDMISGLPDQLLDTVESSASDQTGTMSG